MSNWAVMLSYSSAAIVALILLYWFEPIRWYWHVLAIVIAIGLGLVPIPAEIANPRSDLVIGSVFVLLLFWGAAAPPFRSFHHAHLPHR